jgi:hypothetical protein
MSDLLDILGTFILIALIVALTLLAALFVAAWAL